MILGEEGYMIPLGFLKSFHQLQVWTFISRWNAYKIFTSLCQIVTIPFGERLHHVGCDELLRRHERGVVRNDESWATNERDIKRGMCVFSRASLHLFTIQSPAWSTCPTMHHIHMNIWYKLFISTTTQHYPSHTKCSSVPVRRAYAYP
jgi:hypothetical protein